MSEDIKNLELPDVLPGVDRRTGEGGKPIGGIPTETHPRNSNFAKQSIADNAERVRRGGR